VSGFQSVKCVLCVEWCVSEKRDHFLQKRPIIFYNFTQHTTHTLHFEKNAWLCDKHIHTTHTLHFDVKQTRHAQHVAVWQHMRSMLQYGNTCAACCSVATHAQHATYTLRQGMRSMPPAQVCSVCFMWP